MSSVGQVILSSGLQYRCIVLNWKYIIIIIIKHTSRILKDKDKLNDASSMICKDFRSFQGSTTLCLSPGTGLTFSSSKILSLLEV